MINKRHAHGVVSELYILVGVVIVVTSNEQYQKVTDAGVADHHRPPKSESESCETVVNTLSLSLSYELAQKAGTRSFQREAKRQLPPPFSLLFFVLNKNNCIKLKRQCP